MCLSFSYFVILISFYLQIFILLLDHKEGVLYAFKGVYYWKINDEGAIAGYPRKIHKYWRGLPGNINATVYSKTTGRTYFFKGKAINIILNVLY